MNSYQHPRGPCIERLKDKVVLYSSRTWTPSGLIAMKLYEQILATIHFFLPEAKTLPSPRLGVYSLSMCHAIDFNNSKHIKHCRRPSMLLYRLVGQVFWEEGQTHVCSLAISAALADSSLAAAVVRK